MSATDGDYLASLGLPEISDEHMRAGLGQARPYTVAMLRPTEKFKRPDVDALVWEHGRRNFALREAGLMPIVLPVGAPELSGIGIFAVGEDEARAIMEADPGVEAGIFSFELYPARGFPGSALPG